MQWVIESKGLNFLSNARAFRIFRVAGKIEQLKKIVNAIGTSIVPMAYGFLVSPHVVILSDTLCRPSVGVLCLG